MLRFLSLLHNRSQSVVAKWDQTLRLIRHGRFCRITFNLSLRLFDCSFARLDASQQVPHWLAWKLNINQKITCDEIAFVGRNCKTISPLSLVHWLLYQDLTPLIILNIIRLSRWADKIYVRTSNSIDEQKRGCITCYVIADGEERYKNATRT